MQRRFSKALAGSRAPRQPRARARAHTRTRARARALSKPGGDADNEPAGKIAYAQHAPGQPSRGGKARRLVTATPCGVQATPAELRTSGWFAQADGACPPCAPQMCRGYSGRAELAPDQYSFKNRHQG